MEKQNKIERISSLLDSGSSAAKSGIVSGAKYLSKSIEKGGDYIIHNTVAHEKPVNVKYLEQIEKTSKTTSYAIESSFKILGKATHKAIDVAEKKWNAMPQSEFAKKLLENQKFQAGVTIGIAGARAGMNILSGVSQGLSLIKSSGAKTTVDVVDHRYGEKAAKATSETMSIAQSLLNARSFTYFSGFVSVSATEAMKVQEELEIHERKLELVLNILNNVTI